MLAYSGFGQYDYIRNKQATLTMPVLRMTVEMTMTMSALKSQTLFKDYMDSQQDPPGLRCRVCLLNSQKTMRTSSDRGGVYTLDMVSSVLIP